MPIANVNGAHLYYEIAGVGHPLVLIHGFCLDTRMWDAQFDVFTEYYQVIRYDLRGFGRSTVPRIQENYSHSADLAALLDYLKIDRTFVLGFSRGGRWAIQFALDYKQRIDGLIVADAMPNGFNAQGENPSMSANIILSARSKGVQDARENWLRHPIFQTIKHNSDIFMQLQQMANDYSGWHWLNDDPAIIGLPSSIERLSEITVPTLIVVGEYDLENFRQAADLLYEKIPNAKKVIMSRVGHMSTMENPAKFNEIVLKFLKEISTAGGSYE